MAVNLEELALKSIEQYAALNVKMASLEVALVEMNRRSENSQDKFVHACDKLSRLEEKISAWSEDRKLIHDRIDDTRAEVDKLVTAVRELASTVKDHKEDHCDNCFNEARVDELEKVVASLATKAQVDELDKKITEATRVEASLTKVREMVTTPQGSLTVKFITSKAFIILSAVIAVDIIVDIVGHYDLLARFWNWIHFVQ